MKTPADIVAMRRGAGTCLDQYIQTFEYRLTARNYTSGTIKSYRVLIRRLAMIMEGRCVRPQDLTVELPPISCGVKSERQLNRTNVPTSPGALPSTLSISAWRLPRH